MSGDPSVATISPAGLAVGIAPGSSSISASIWESLARPRVSVSPPLVTLTHVDPIVKRHKVTKIVLTFSGASRGSGSEKNLYEIIIAGKKALFTAKNAMIVKVSKLNQTPPAQTP